MRDKSERATTVVCPVTVAVGLPGDPVVPLSAELCYDAADPYAVRLSLGAPEAREPVDWFFSRSLLEEGMRRPTGIGNVLVSPSHRGRDGSVAVVVRSAGVAARIEVPALRTAEFLRRSHALVPTGQESPHVDIDRALAALMNICE
ncbi:SsgA family sporulation/cell division regulator [Streptomyces sp. NPDC048376]|uniref:SsgA family sporulation/cell division regulator n=1 Tax=Streptomyces TaxID=1883 RepID=UPI0024931E7C|nr:SsgA family sporulation/cell division regulator [Streptomyces tendae]